MFRRARGVFACFVLTALLVSVSGCAGGGFKLAGGAKSAEITVAAASDTKPALTKIAADFKRATGATVNLTFGSSGLLARQIENGAPIDIFISANKEFIDQLAAKKLIGDSTPYARGFIVLIGKAQTHGDLLLPTIKKIAVANPKHAPYGKAAMEILRNDGTWPKTKDKLVYAENVAQAYEFVRTGNADAGFVALSLAKAAGVSYVLVNQRLYKPIDQWAAVMKKTDRPKTARAFMKWLFAPGSLKTLEVNGLQPLAGSGVGAR